MYKFKDFNIEDWIGFSVGSFLLLSLVCGFGYSSYQIMTSSLNIFYKLWLTIMLWVLGYVIFYRPR